MGRVSEPEVTRVCVGAIDPPSNELCDLMTSVKCLKLGLLWCREVTFWFVPKFRIDGLVRVQHSRSKRQRHANRFIFNGQYCKRSKSNNVLLLEPEVPFCKMATLVHYIDKTKN